MPNDRRKSLLQKKCEKVVKDPEKSNKILRQLYIFLYELGMFGISFSRLVKEISMAVINVTEIALYALDI